MSIVRMMVAAVCLVVAACKPTDGVSAKPVKPLNKWEVASDMAIGNPAAKVVVIEYASVTCVHCAHFHETVWPAFKKKYVDTGKVRFIFREFPTPPVPIAVAGFMVARCAGKTKYFSMIDALFRSQETILSSNSPRAELLKIAKIAGMDEAKFNTCIADEKELERIQGVINVGLDTYKIQATPSFIINGELKSGLTTIEKFDAALKPLLAKK